MTQRKMSAGAKVGGTAAGVGASVGLGILSGAIRAWAGPGFGAGLDLVETAVGIGLACFGDGKVRETGKVLAYGPAKSIAERLTEGGVKAMLESRAAEAERVRQEQQRDRYVALEMDAPPALAEQQQAALNPAPTAFS